MSMSKRPAKPAPRRCAKADCNLRQPCPKHYNKEWSNTDYYTPIPQKDKDEVRRQAHGICRKCGGVANPGAVDHIVNVASGGKNDMSNYQLLCKRCHDVKSQREAKDGRKRKRNV